MQPAIAEQGQVADTPVEETAPQGQPTETPEPKVEETEANPSTETEEDGGIEEVQETVDDKLERLERETAGKQKKIDRQTAANRRTQELYEKQRQENEKLSALIKQQEPETEPKIEDFETHEAYNDAVKAHITKQAKAEAQQEFLVQKQQAQQQQREQEQLVLRRSQEAEYIVDHPMYTSSAKEVGSYIDTLEGASHGTQEAVISQLYQGNVPSVIDYFGSNNGENLDELGKIARMAPPMAAVEIYKIQQKLLANPVKKQIKPKITPVNTPRGNPKHTKPLNKQTGSDILDWVNSK